MEQGADLFSMLVDAIADRVVLKLRGTNGPERVIMSVREVGKYIKRSPSKVRELVESGQLPAIKEGRKVQILKEDVEQWLSRARM
jgi:excisionase family DNA binding protein